MSDCIFVSDLHGKTERYEKLFRAMAEERPEAVFLGGDLFPNELASIASAESVYHDFVNDYLIYNLSNLKAGMGTAYPRIFIILGNDDGRFEEPELLQAETRGIWEYAHFRKIEWHDYTVFGYSYVPPTPFRLKDWERYDLSRYVDPGAVSPEEGWYSQPLSDRDKRYSTIKKDLEQLTAGADLSRAIMLFHSPPYSTKLDLFDAGQRMIDGVPPDNHLGSLAMRRLIEERQPLITLHGHVHEAARLSGSWRDEIGQTHLFSAAHDGPELALVRFDPGSPAAATRQLI